MSASKKTVLAISFLLLGLAIGYVIGTSVNRSSSPIFAPSQKIAQAADRKDLFKNQSATIQGQIIKITDDKVTLLSSQGGIEEFGLSDYWKMTAAKQKSATSSANKDSLQLNREALIVLELVNSQYQIRSITYIPQKDDLSALSR